MAAISRATVIPVINGTSTTWFTADFSNNSIGQFALAYAQTHVSVQTISAPAGWVLDYYNNSNSANDTKALYHKILKAGDLGIAEWSWSSIYGLKGVGAACYNGAIGIDNLVVDPNLDEGVILHPIAHSSSDWILTIWSFILGTGSSGSLYLDETLLDLNVYGGFYDSNGIVSAGSHDLHASGGPNYNETLVAGISITNVSPGFFAFF